MGAAPAAVAALVSPLGAVQLHFLIAATGPLLGRLLQAGSRMIEFDTSTLLRQTPAL